MPLLAGTRRGPYEIVATIGAGGTPAADGKRFQVSTEPDASAEAPPLTVVVNWLAAVKK